MFDHAYTQLHFDLGADDVMILELDTGLTADAVEWCPLEGAQELLACGTYQLVEGTGERVGKLHLLELLPAEQESDGRPRLVSCASTTGIVSHGILDMKWHSCSSESCRLALATSHGSVVLLALNNKKVLERESSCSVEVSEGGLCLSLDFARDSSGLVGVSDSKGSVSLVDVGHESVLRQWGAHQFEAWITAFGSCPSEVFSGGDDSKLLKWDVRTSCEKPTASFKGHSMGVCSLHSHPSLDHVIASGSYDESLLLWDDRNASAPLKEGHLGGGVWRIKWYPSGPSHHHHHHQGLLAAACMHNGCWTLDCNVASGEPMELLHHYTGHGSLAYGVDWCKSRESCLQRPSPVAAEVGSIDGGGDVDGDGSSPPRKEPPLLLASCSFYDHSLHIWSTDIDRHPS